MATYEEIYGKRVEVLDTDPTLNSAYEGQVWYNSASGTLKSVVSFSAWSSQPNTINDLSGGGSNGFGTSSTSALFTGGGPPSPATAGSQKTEEWNGSGFAAQADIPQTLNQMNDGNMGFGTTTSGLVSGSAPGSGAINNWSQDWNGTSWEATPTMPTTGRGTAAGYGVLTAGLNIGGYGNPIPPGRLTRAEEYTGSAWTSGGTLSTGRYNIGGGAGTQTSAAACGGQGPSDKELVVENYDGSSFTSGVSLPQKLRGGRTAGTSDSAYIFWGGSAPPGMAGETLEFDGTAFTDLGADMTTAGSSGVCAGTTTAAINIMSGPSPGQNKTQEFSKSISSIVEGAWASGATMNNSGTSSAGFGTMTAGALAGTGPGVDFETYDGTSWTDRPNLNSNHGAGGGAGTTTAGLCFGGNPTSTADSEEWNGSAWSEGDNLNQARSSLGSANSGTQTAALAFGGETNPGGTIRNLSESYNGTSWTAGPTLNTARYGGAGAGTSTAALFAGGNTPPFTANSEEWNGSSWSEGNNLITARRDLNGAANGLQTSALLYAGEASPGTTGATEGYDGTTWSTRPSLSTAGSNRSGFNSAGNTAAIAAGPSSSTEEFTGATTAVTAKTLTTS